MKTRNGFVSNSSSSSFIVLTTQKNLENIRQQYQGNPFLEFMDVVIGRNPKTVKIHGMELVDLSRVIHDGYIDRWDEEEHGQDCSCGYDLWIQFTDDIAKGGGYVSSDGC